MILLSIGESDIGTPPAIVEQAVRSLRAGHTRYMPTAGLESLREAIARHVGQIAGTSIASERVVYFPGAQTALYAVCQCILDAGDEVIVPEPTYVTYEAVLGSTGARIVNVPLLPERRFHLEPDDVERAVTSRTRAVLLTSPHNPTGAVMTPAEITAVGEICRRHDLWLVCDEVYADLTFDAEYASPLSLSGIDDRVVSVSSLSKSHSMTGLARRLGHRAGRARGAPDLPHHVHALRSDRVRAGRGAVRTHHAARRGHRAARAVPPPRGRDDRRVRTRRPAAAAHARGRDVPHARRALDGPERRCVRATPARGGGRVGAAGRGLRPERRGPRPDLRDDGRGSAARGMPEDRAARG